MKVAVVGLGAAGLRAAMALNDAGADLELYDARSRVGGRLLTVGEFEAGAEFLDSDHVRALALLEQLGMSAIPEQASAQWFFAGDLYKSLPDEAAQDLAAISQRACELAANLKPEPWLNPEHAELDEKSLSAFLDENCETMLGRWYAEAYFRSDEGDDTKCISLLGWLCNFKQYAARPSDALSAFRIGSGTAVAEAMLRCIGIEPHLEKKLKAVRQNRPGVELIFEKGHSTVDAVVLALPPAILAHLEIEPQMPAGKHDSFQKARMGSAMKICIQFEKPVWEDIGWSGESLNDLYLQQTWNSSRNGAHILNAYICGSPARELARKNNALATILGDLEMLCPGIGEFLLHAQIFDWPSMPETCGGFSHLAPGYASKAFAHAAEPWGNVFFAGEHTSLYTGFLEGALESGERAAAQLLHALGRA